MATLSRRVTWYDAFPLFAGAGVVAVGLIALAGWQLDVPNLRSFVPGRVAMNPLTAVCFALSGAAMLATGRMRALAIAFASIVALLGGIKLIGLLIGWDAGLDRILYASMLDRMSPPNRMAPNTALNFMASGIGLGMALGSRSSLRLVSKQVCLLPLLLSFLGLIGYLYDVNSFYGLSNYIPMALNTVLCFLVLSAGTLLLHPHEGWTNVFVSEDLGGTTLRRLLPLTVGALVLLGWLRLMGQGLGLYETHVGVSLHVFVSCVLIAVVIWTSARSLSLSDSERLHAAEALKRANDSLELRVQERTAELTGAQRALRKSEEQLRQSQKMEAIGRLAGGVAHDFNNMLTAILGHAQLMRMRLRPEDAAYRDTEEIELAAKRAGTLTRQLLAFSRQQVLEPRILDLNTLISEMDRMLRRLIGADIDILTAPASSLGRVKADPGQIEQVLLNLVVNARDAMPHGGKITIETANVELDESYARSHGAVQVGRYVLLAVTDSGCGIDPEVKSRIFEPFFTTKEAGKGTGLGLSTVYGIVHQSGGHIDVYSEVARGTAFKVYLPLVEGALTPATPLARAAAPDLRGSETVLVVEDEGLVRGVIRQGLELNGYRVIEASDGDQAIRALESAPSGIDLIVTDVMMPRMTGPELAARLMATKPGLKVLFISGYTDAAVIHHRIVPDGTAYLQKPFSPDALACKVRQVLDGPDARAA